MIYSPRQLTVELIERAIQVWTKDLPRPLVDLSRLEHLDLFAAVVLVLFARRCREQGGFLRVLLPERDSVRSVLAAPEISRLLQDAVWTKDPWPEPSSTRMPIDLVEVGEEAGVTRLVDDLDDRLRERFPLGEVGRNILAEAMIELFQNIPQHAALAENEAFPFGISGVQELDDHIHLVVADNGIGLAKSLATNPQYHGLTDAAALDAILVQGVSRFDRPGRGGALRRIRELALRNAGALFVRSAAGALWQVDVEWAVEEVHPFPGVQVSIRLPRSLFE
jgi:ABC-type transporter Mla MlaB component